MIEELKGSLSLKEELDSSAVETTVGVSGLDSDKFSWLFLILGGPVPEWSTGLDWSSERGEIFVSSVNMESRSGARVDPV
jgi:hypothetical protein